MPQPAARFRALAVRLLALAGILSLALPGLRAQGATALSAPTPQVHQGGELHGGQTTSGKVEEGVVDVFTIQLKAGEFLHVTVVQGETSIVARIIRPDGRLAAYAEDSLPFPGHATVSTICKDPGTYKLYVNGELYRGEAATYELHVDPLAPADNHSLLLFNAEQDTAVGIVLSAQGAASLEKARASAERGARSWHDVGDYAQEARAYLFLALLDAAAGVSDWQRSLGYLESARSAAELAKDVPLQSAVYSRRSFTLILLLRFTEAAADAQRAVDLAVQYGHPYLELRPQLMLAWAEFRAGHSQQAITAANRALTIIKDRRGNGLDSQLLSGVAGVASRLGSLDVALVLDSQALRINQEIKDEAQLITTLHDIGSLQERMGEFTKAQDSYNESLALARKLHDLKSEAQDLNSLAFLDPSHSNADKSIDLMNQALALQRQVNDTDGQAATLDNLAVIESQHGKTEEAVKLVSQAVDMEHASNNNVGEANALITLSEIYAEAGNKELAEQTGTRSLLAMSSKDPDLKAACLNNVADVLLQNGRADLVTSALQASLGALALARQTGSIQKQAKAESLIMRAEAARNQSEVAILFGIRAVNDLQGLRKNLTGLDEDARVNFSWSESEVYRDLAGLLAGSGRLRESEQVMTLLKLSEDREERNSYEVPESAERLNFTAAETQVLPAADKAIETAGKKLAIGAELVRLQSIASPSDADVKSIARLQAETAPLNPMGELDAVGIQIQIALAKHGIPNATGTTFEEGASTFQSIADLLPSLPAGTMSVYTLVGAKKSYLIVSTAHSKVSYRLDFGSDFFQSQVAGLFGELMVEGGNPDPELQSLSHVLINPLSAKIREAAKQSPDGIVTILWSLDGVLRYVPLNTLMLNGAPLIEAARNVIVTPESRARLLEPSSNRPMRMLALGLSKSYGGADPLPGVQQELASIVHDGAAKPSWGHIEGRLLADDAFTLNALEGGLAQNYSLVHVASHFFYKPGNSGDSYLLMSNWPVDAKGYDLTLTQVREDPKLNFDKVKLLTLSACRTAVVGNASNGREIDSFGMALQKRGAASVIATLWQVNDASTSRLMSDFYARWAAQPALGKAEALRQAQLDLLHGKTSTPGQETKTPGASADFSKPYFWAPFILIGNFL